MSKHPQIAVSELKIGMYINLPMTWKDHPFLLSRFKLKSQSQIEIIKGLGLDSVSYDPKRSDVEVSQALDDATTQSDAKNEQDIDQLKQQMLQEKSQLIDQSQQLKRNIRKTERQFKQSVSLMHSVTGKIATRPDSAMHDAKQLISSLSQFLHDEQNLALHLMQDAKPNDIVHHHSLNVAMLCMLLAKTLKWSKEDIELIGFGSLFHDIGKMKIPSHILNKVVPLSIPEENLIKQHPLFSLNQLKLADNFPEEAKAMIANHHEFLDGSGYPKGLKEEALDKFSQLLAVVNEYDTLCNGSKLVKAKTPSIALGLLYKNYAGKLNKSFVENLIKIIGIYPPGSIVELSSGQYGLVMSVNINHILYPSIVAYDPSIPQDQSPIIDLKKEGISILRSLPPSALPAKVLKYLAPRETVSYGVGRG